MHARQTFVVLLSGLLLTVTACSSGSDASSSDSLTPATNDVTVTTLAEPAIDDQFVVAPSNLTDLTPGDVIRHEKVSETETATTYRILYVSTTVNDQPAAVTATLTAPLIADSAQTNTPLPVIAWAHPTVGLADACAPSNDPTLTTTFTSILTAARPAVVVAADYAGLGTPGPHPYLNGKVAGRNVLDSLVAARNFSETLQLALTADNIVWGYSQGGHAALWAASLAPEYPELALTGVAAQAPPTDLVANAQYAYDNADDATLLVAGLYGAAVSSSEIRLNQILTPTADEALIELEYECIDGLDVFSKPSLDEVFASSPLANDAVVAQLKTDSAPTAGVTVPVFVGQGKADQVVPSEITDVWVADACRAGTNVTYKTSGFADHTTLAFLGAAPAVTWILERLDGTAPISTC